jgi:hypothetical protein
MQLDIRYEWRVESKYKYIYKLGSCQLAMFDYRRVTPRKKNEQQCNRKYVEDIPYITL